MQVRKGRAAVLGAVAGAGVLALAGVAFACTQTVGKITISGVSVGSTTLSTGSETYEADGGDFENSTAGYCGGKPTTRVQMASATPGELAFNLAVTAPNCTSSPHSSRDPYTTKMDAGPWEVRWVATADGAIDNTAPYPECHFPRKANSTWVHLGVLMVDASGNGSGTFSLTGTQSGPTGMFGPGNICVDDGKTNFAPPIIPMKWATAVI